MNRFLYMSGRGVVETLSDIFFRLCHGRIGLKKQISTARHGVEQCYLARCAVFLKRDVTAVNADAQIATEGP